MTGSHVSEWLGRRSMSIHASSRLTYEKPAAAMPDATMASAMASVRFSLMRGPNLFQLHGETAPAPGGTAVVRWDINCSRT